MNVLTRLSTDAMATAKRVFFRVLFIASPCIGWIVVSLRPLFSPRLEIVGIDERQVIRREREELSVVDWVLTEKQ